MCASEAPVLNSCTGSLFDEQYYAVGCGSPYERNQYWLNFFGSIADEIVRCLKPNKVLDAGCAFGFLVESFWDRGVEAYGFDISSYAIGQVRRDMRPYCKCQSISDPIEGTFDLITCIEVLEHLRPEETRAAIENLTGHADTILFSSTPSDLREPTHFNVRPTMGWIEAFAEFGFAPVIDFDAGFVSPHAFLLRRLPRLGRQTEMLFSNWLRLRAALFAAQDRATTLEQQIAELESQRDSSVTGLTQRLSDHSTVRNELALARQEVGRLRGEAAHAESEIRFLRETNLSLGQARDELVLTVAHARDEFGLARQEVERSRSEATRAESEIRSLRAMNSSLVTELDSSDQTIRDISSDAVKHAFSRQLVPLTKLVSDAVRETLLVITRRRAHQVSDLTSLCGDAELVATSQLFDPRWYLAHASRGDIEARRNPVLHYLTHARKQRTSPGPAFDSQSYLLHNPDVAAAGMDPLVHYLRHGATEGRKIHPVEVGSSAPQAGPAETHSEPPDVTSVTPDTAMEARVRAIRKSGLFDADWYLQQYPAVASAGIDPAIHFLRYGAAERRNPGPKFDSAWYLENNPDVAAASLNPLIHYIDYGRAEARAIRDVPDPSLADSQLRNRFPDLKMPAFPAPSAGKRVTVVTDSINARSLYGGVGTALILATLLANRIGASLRIVTRTDAPNPTNLKHVLASNGISCEVDVEFVHVPPDESRPLPISETDTFVTTSWWTTTAVKQVAPSENIVYLLQEDERMFYPFGDDRLRCAEALSTGGISFVVNSQLLFQHFTVGHEPLPNIASRGLWFEPAFPSSHYFPEQNHANGAKKQFFFYARPYNLRNLYWRGLEAIARAIERGVLDPSLFEFHFVGHGLGRVSLPGKPIVHVLERLQWSDYAALVRRIDIALSLMDTPHPSYPPLDLAASGAIVVTNRHGIKTSLSDYSENIICCEPAVDSLVDGIRAAMALANDDSTRLLNYSRNRLQRDWTSALSAVVDRLAATIAGAA
jgi:hypothetical protein